jgi:hypothetical protein
MKFFTPERSELIVITAIDKHPDGLIISGKIMGTMPMRAVLTPAQLRAGFKFLSPKLVFTLFGMLFRR